MNAKYNYVLGATAANVLSDLVAIMTGETNRDNLSASCNKTTTTIDGTTPSGWTLHDTAAGTNARCIKAPLADDPATFKYVVIDTNSAGVVFTKVYETWDASTHTGTNVAYMSNSSSYQQRWSTVINGTIYILSNERFMLFASLYVGLWGSTTSSGPSGCFERSRVCAWDTVAAGWPPYCFCSFGDIASSSNGAWPPRMMNKYQATVATGATTVYTAQAGPMGSVSSMMTTLASIDQKIPDEAGSLQIPMFPIVLISTANMPVPYGDLSTICDVWVIPANTAANLDIIKKAGVEYLALQASGPTKMIVIKKV